MPYLTPKPKSANAWLPSQVQYGIDCSDPDPERWTPFGEQHDKRVAELAKHGAKTESKPSA